MMQRRNSASSTLLAALLILLFFLLPKHTLARPAIPAGIGESAVLNSPNALMSGHGSDNSISSISGNNSTDTDTEIVEPFQFTSFANAPNKSFDGFSFVAQNGVIKLGGNLTETPCPPAPESCSIVAGKAPPVTAFAVNASLNGTMDNLNPAIQQNLFLTAEGELSYLTTANPEFPPGAFLSGFKTFTSPPRGLHATINRTWRPTLNDTSGWYACPAGRGAGWTVYADVPQEAWQEGRRNVREECTQFVGVAVPWNGKAVWEYL